MTRRKKVCACALVNGHCPCCPHRHQIVSHEIDFGALAKTLKEMEKVVSEKTEKKPRKKKRPA